MERRVWLKRAGNEHGGVVPNPDTSLILNPTSLDSNLHECGEEGGREL